MFVNIDSKEAASEWVAKFQYHLKMMIPQIRGYDIKGNWILF